MAKKKDTIDLQKNECCKYWITIWFDKIADAIHDTEGGHLKYCPECATKFKTLK